MKHRYFTPDDYEMICKWWQDWSWQPLPLAALPRTGIIVTNEGVDLAASFIYTTDSCVCWAENFISNKEAPRHLRKGSIEFLIEKTIEEGKNQGFMMMMSSVEHEGLIKKLTDANFLAAEKGMTNLVRAL